MSFQTVTCDGYTCKLPVTQISRLNDLDRLVGDTGLLVEYK